MFATIDEHENLACIHAAECFLRIALLSAQPEPEHIHRRANVLRQKAGLGPHGRMPAIGANDQIGSDFEPPLGHLCDNAADGTIRLDKILDIRLHAQMKRRMQRTLASEEIEEIPLRREGDELRSRRQM